MTPAEEHGINPDHSEIFNKLFTRLEKALYRIQESGPDYIVTHRQRDEITDRWWNWYNDKEEQGKITK